MLALRPQPTRAPTTVPPSRASASATLATSSPPGARCLSPRFVARSLRRATESNDAGTASSPRRRCSTRVLVSRVSRTPPSPPRTSPSPSPSRRRPRPVYPDDTSAPLFDTRAPPPRRTPLFPARRDPTRGDPSLGVVVAVSRRLFRRARSPRRRRLFRASSPRRLARLRLRSPCGTRVVRGRRAPARRTVEHHLRVEGIAVEVRHAERGTPRGRNRRTRREPHRSSRRRSSRGG